MVLVIITIIVRHLGVGAVHGLVWRIQTLLRHHRGECFEFMMDCFCGSSIKNLCAHLVSKRCSNPPVLTIFYLASASDTIITTTPSTISSMEAASMEKTELPQVPPPHPQIMNLGNANPAWTCSSPKVPAKLWAMIHS